MSSDPEKKQLPFGKLTYAEIPKGHGFDKFGLLVQQQFAVADPNQSTTATSDRSATDASKETSTQPTPTTNDEAIDTNIQRLIEHMETDPPPEDSAADKTQPNDPGETTENRGRDTAVSGNTTGEECESSESEDDCEQPEQCPSPELSSTEGQPTRRSQRAQKKPSYREPPSRMAKGAAAPKTRQKPATRCCPAEVPPTFVSILTPTVGMDPLYRLETAKKYSDLQDQLCVDHLRAFSWLMSSAVLAGEELEEPEVTQDGAATGFAEVSPRKRPLSMMSELARASLYKRLKLNDASDTDQARPPSEPNASGAPALSNESDEAFRERVISQLRQNASEGKVVPRSYGERADQLILEILRNSRTPEPVTEALICDGDAAMEAVESGRIDVPIFTEGQQQFRWNNGARPILQLFQRMEDGLDRNVSVQVSSCKLSGASAEVKSFREVQERFLGEARTDGQTWTLLDLRSPLPSLLPGFLMGPNARLLHQASNSILAGDSIGRAGTPGAKRTEWKNVLDWLLLSAGGNTAPHRDASGFATWMTVQEGQVGFAWLSKPSDQELQDWMAKPFHYSGRQWRYRVVRAGQTIFIPTGLVHCVFRPDEEQTLAVGGHLLLWSDGDRWSRVVVEEMEHDKTTNEDVDRQYVSAISKLITDRSKRGRVQELGGAAALVEFHANIKELMRLFRNRL